MSFNAVEYLTKLINESDSQIMILEEAISWLDEQGFRYEFEERAAILEYEGGLTREDADEQALREIIVRKNNGTANNQKSSSKGW